MPARAAAVAEVARQHGLRRDELLGLAADEGADLTLSRWPPAWGMGASRGKTPPAPCGGEVRHGANSGVSRETCTKKRHRR